MSPLPGWAGMKSRFMAVSPRRRALLALAMVFAAGLAGGALLEDVVDDLDNPFAAAGDHDDNDDFDSEEDILANLDLTPDQRAGIERVFQAREDRLERYWESQLPGLETVVDSSRAEIRTILSPAQRATYDSGLTRLRVYSKKDWREDHDD